MVGERESIIYGMQLTPLKITAC